MDRNVKAATEQAARRSPVAWFVVLERARLVNDFATAARATEILKSLGVEVRYLPSAVREVSL